MSDAEDSAVTYTSISNDDGLSDIGSPGAVVYRYDGLPIIPQAPPSPDYMPGLEEPQAPPLPGFVLERIYPEMMMRILRRILRRTPPIILLMEETMTTMMMSHTMMEEDDDDVDIEEEEDEDEEEHLDPVDSTTIALPTIDHAPSAEETEPFETCGSFDFNRSLSLKCV
nr:hypothetical protein [Tanacetum cinerariifolium]